jgi:hypothetical protein
MKKERMIEIMKEHGIIPAQAILAAHDTHVELSAETNLQAQERYDEAMEYKNKTRFWSLTRIVEIASGLTTKEE